MLESQRPEIRGGEKQRQRVTNSEGSSGWRCDTVMVAPMFDGRIVGVPRGIWTLTA